MKDFTEEIDRSLDLLFKVEQVQKKKKQFIDKAKNVYLQVMLFKLPFTAPRKRKLVRLRHSLYGDDPEICLFVPNRKTGVEYKKTTDELIDFCVDYYTEFLEKHKVKGISTVMPFKQLTSEYGTYDLRRKLVRRFDLFLCKKSLLYNSKFISALGKTFKVANKMPFGVRFPKDDGDFDPEFQKNIEKAILTSGFYINRFSDNYSIPIGTVANTRKELKENLETVLEQLFERQIIPGGLPNVRALYLWPSQSKSIPLYINLELPIGMKTPRDKIRKKRIRGIGGEISTQLSKSVFVTPSGDVFVQKLKGKSKQKVAPSVQEIDFEDDESFKDESDTDDEGDRIESIKANSKPTGAKEEEEDSDTEDDEEIEEREMRLMEEKIKVEKEEEGSEEEEEEEEEVETNENFGQKQRSKRKRKNESADEGTFVAKKKKSGKGTQNGKINKAQKKALMKQQKCKPKEKINQKRKSKQKKV